MQNKINHVKYTKTYTPRQLVLPLNYGISLEQDRLVCIVDALLERLDYSALQHLYSVKGRNPKVPPKILFKVMVFAAAQGVYSLRSISEQCRVNIEYMWLLEGYPAPSHMTFGRFFHRIPIEVLRHLFAQFVHQLSLLDSVDFTEWYIDGTKMEANANRYTFVWRKRVEKGIAKLKEKRRQIQEQMLAFTGMDTFTLDDDELLRSAADVCQGNGITFVQGSGHRKTVEQKLFEEVAAIREKQQEYDAHLTILGTRNSYSKTDPDATFMRMKEDHMKNGQLKPAYNLQLAVQSEYIIGLGLFPNPTDTRILIPFLTALESEYGRLADHIVADAGYDSEENMDWIEKKGSTVCIKPREYEYRKTSAFKKKIGHRSNMAYDADSDTYTCAKGRKLHFIEEGLEVGAGSECLIQFFHHVVVEEDGIVILVAIGVVAVDLLVAFGMVVGVGHVASHIMKDDEGLLAALQTCELFGEGIVVDVKVGGGAEVTVSPVLLVGFGGNDGGRGIPGAEADLVADPYGVESGGFGDFDERGGVCEGHVVVLVLRGQSIGECRDGLHVTAVGVIKEKEVRVVSARRKPGGGRAWVAIDTHVLTILGFADGKDVEAGS